MSTTIVRRSHIHKKDNIGSLLVDGSGGPDTSILPLFYYEEDQERQRFMGIIQEGFIQELYESQGGYS